MIPNHCTKCDICIHSNFKPLHGDGYLDAAIMFVSRNPTALEHKKDIPLISVNGLVFQQFLDLFNFNRDTIYITNAVKCKTPSNRVPTETEIVNCNNYLQIEINKVNPKIIVLIGDVAIKSYFNLTFKNISINDQYLNGKYVVHNGRIIIFMANIAHGVTSVYVRTNMYRAFLTLLRLYRVFNPFHTTNCSL